MLLGSSGSFYSVSVHRDLTVPSGVGRPALDWNVSEWLNVPADARPTRESVAGKVCCVFLVQVLCPGTKSHGWPTIQAVARRTANDSDVELIVVQTPFTLVARNNFANLKRAAAAANLHIPVGQLESVAEFAAACGQRGTPWVLLIDKAGTIQFSNYLVRPEELLARMDELRH